MNSVTKKVTQEVFLSEISAAMQAGSSRFVFWFYPETTEKKRSKITGHFQEHLVGREIVQPVTLYGTKNPKPVEVSPFVFRLTNTSIEKMAEIYTEIVSSCDSVATYAEKKPSFAWAIVFHEDEIFLQED